MVNKIISNKELQKNYRKVVSDKEKVNGGEVIRVIIDFVDHFETEDSSNESQNGSTGEIRLTPFPILDPENLETNPETKSKLRRKLRS